MLNVLIMPRDSGKRPGALGMNGPLILAQDAPNSEVFLLLFGLGRNKSGYFAD